ncbi:MAG: hypothetical protein H6747_01255 [Deltaproteobacteria bacterium]|nr:hypothetical protein [Deltaproteobacteria bacterium]
MLQFDKPVAWVIVLRAATRSTLPLALTVALALPSLTYAQTSPVVLPQSMTPTTVPSPVEQVYLRPERRVGGVVAGVLIGFGSGHLVQGRYLGRGLFFTISEAVTFIAGIHLVAEASGGRNPFGLSNGTAFGIGLTSQLTWAVLRIWQIGDLIWAAPPAPPRGERNTATSP